MKYTIPEVLRRLIEVFDEQANSSFQSGFICDQLAASYALSVEVSADDRARALWYLQRLGMGRGFTEFYTEAEEEEEDLQGGEGPPPPYSVLRHRRQAWLSFAADLYEEGFAC